MVIDCSEGQYFARPFEESSSDLTPTYFIPEAKYRDWEEFNDRAREWHKYWKALHNRLDRPHCEHEYLPDEDGTVYRCGKEDDLVYIDGYFYCEDHFNG